MHGLEVVERLSPLSAIAAERYVEDRSLLRREGELLCREGVLRLNAHVDIMHLGVQDQICKLQHLLEVAQLFRDTRHRHKLSEARFAHFIVEKADSLLYAQGLFLFSDLRLENFHVL